MLSELCNHDHLGTPNQIYYVLTSLLSDVPRTISNIRRFTWDNALQARLPIDGILSLFKEMSLLEINGEENIRLTLDGKKFAESVLNENDFINRFAVALLAFFGKELFQYFGEFSYSVQNETYRIFNNYIPLKYSSFKRLFLGFEIFLTGESRDVLLINRLYFPEFKRIMKSLDKCKASKILDNALDGHISEEQLLVILQHQREMGQIAEEFAYFFELRRLSGHRQIGKVEIISEIDTSAGYDIISFESTKSEHLNRYIEVKSFSGNLEFYWSRNEVETAKRKKESYYLYLVNRNQINNLKL